MNYYISIAARKMSGREPYYLEPLKGGVYEPIYWKGNVRWWEYFSTADNEPRHVAGTSGLPHYRRDSSQQRQGKAPPVYSYRRGPGDTL